MKLGSDCSNELSEVSKALASPLLDLLSPWLRLGDRFVVICFTMLPVAVERGRDVEGEFVDGAGRLNELARDCWCCGALGCDWDAGIRWLCTAR